MQDHIFIKGARENNLKNIDVTIPRDKLVVLTGLSGSGKSSLAFDTIYAEGQRRYVESLSSYARMFLGQMDKPDVDYIDGLSPAISIDQKTTSKNPRSTVGTVTEIYDYLRLLWARVGTPHCPKCGKEIRQQTIDQIIDQIMALPEGTRIQVLAPVVRGRKGEHAKVFEDARRSGYVRVRADGNLYDLSEDIPLDKNKKHSIEIVVDRLIVRPDGAQRLTDSVETASHLSGGIVLVNLVREGQDLTFSQNYACDDCGISIEELTPRMFSFNNPFGACPTCTGLGMQLKADPAIILPDDSLSILDGAIVAPGWNSIRSDGISRMYFEALAKKYRFSLQTPVRQLSPEVRDVIFYGTRGEKLELHYDQPRGRGTLYQPFEGIANNLERRYQETQSDASKRELEEFMTQCPCPACKGRRLRPEALAVTVGGLSIMEATELPVDRELEFFNTLTLTPTQQLIAAQILKEIRARLGFLQSVGLSYLTLSRSSGTLSGGESQRIRLATQIGSSLMGVLYILDEPSIGLHQRDNDKLLATLKRLRDLGNTLIVVEHDEDTMRAADYLIDIGPGAGAHGGQVMAAGTPEEVMANPNSLTGQYLSGKRSIPVPEKRRPGSGEFLTVRGAAENNLRHIDVSVPLGTFTCVTGVSGRVREILSGQRDHLQAPGGRPEPDEGPAWPARRHRGRGVPGQGGGHRPEPHRPHPPLQSRHLYGAVQRDPQSVRRHPGGQGPGLRPGTILLQHPWRPVRGLLRRRSAEDRDALSGGRVRPLRGVPRQALQPGNPGGEIQGQEHLRRAGHDGGGGAGIFRPGAQDRRKAADPVRCGPGLCEAGPVLHHAVRRRGPAGEAGHGAVPPGHGPHLLYPG